MCFLLLASCSNACGGVGSVRGGAGVLARCSSRADVTWSTVVRCGDGRCCDWLYGLHAVPCVRWKLWIQALQTRKACSNGGSELQMKEIKQRS